MVKINVYKLQFFLIGLLGFYPLLKFNISSLVLIIIFILSFYISIKDKTFSLTKKNVLTFLTYSAYFLLTAISIFYSTNKEEGINRIIQLLPLLLVPLLICFNNYKSEFYTHSAGLIIFLISNFIFTLVITYLFLLNVNKYGFDIGHFIYDYDKFQFIINENIKADALFVHKAYYSMGFVICAIFCLYEGLKVFENNKLYSGLFGLGFLYFFVWCFYAFSFPNIIALIISIFILLFKTLRFKTFIYSISFFTLGIILLIGIKHEDVDVQRGFNFIKSITKNKPLEINDTRLEIYRSYKSIYKSANITQILTGFGVGDVQDKLNNAYKTRIKERKIINLIQFNEEFNNLYWYKNNVDVIPNEVKFIDNKLSGDLIFENKRLKAESHNISKKIFLSRKGLYTFSVFAKKDKKSQLILRFGNIDQMVVFDLERGVESKKANVYASSIKKTQYDWFRCSISVFLEEESLAVIGLSNQDSEYIYKGTGGGLYLSGAQIEYGSLTEYKKNSSELLFFANKEKLNSHNNYLFFLLASGIFGLAAFCIALGHLLIHSVKKGTIIQISFAIIIIFNCLTENILSRQWGLIFFSFMILVFYLSKKPQ